MRGFIASFVLASVSLIPLAHGAGPTTLPTVPVLKLDGGAGPRSFAVAGVMYLGDGPGLGFRMARDGDRTFCAVFDASDGTPLFLSDGKQTLIYDLPNDRVIAVPDCKGYAMVAWHPRDARPLSFTFGADMETANASASTTPASTQAATQASKTSQGSGIDVSAFLTASHDLRRISDEPNETYGDERKESLSVVEIDPKDASTFRFYNIDKARGRYKLVVEATRIGAKIPDELLRFPNLAQLKKDAPVCTLPPETLAGFAKQLADGTAYLPKFALASGTEMQKNAADVLPHADWDALRKEDVTLGATYRAALAKQRITLTALATPQRAIATTQPTTRPS